MHLSNPLVLSSLISLSLALPQLENLVVQPEPGRLPISYNDGPTFKTYASSSGGSKSGGIDLEAKASQPFTIKAYNSVRPEIHMMDIVVSRRQFFIGNLTRSLCPKGINDCPAGNVTALKVNEDRTAQLDVQIDRKQSIYVGPRAQLRFQPPGFAVPNNAQKVSFFLSPNPIPAEPAKAAFIFRGRGGPGRATGYLACPLPEFGHFQVLVDLGNIKDSWIPSGNRSECIGFDAFATNYTSPTPAAYAYI
ncbi:MAG: hypothetical protein Q9182_002575 [Xanthomendoza sp. 2 TL-2023]